MLESNLDLSVTICTLDEGKNIKECLLAVIAQKPSEIIVVDGGKDEQVKSYLTQYPDIIYMTSNKNHPNILRNLGVDCANGKWVAFLDDDDSWMSEKIDRQIKQAWSLASFSSLTAGLNINVPDYDATGTLFPASDKNSRKDIFSFPKGMRSGICIHKIFEEIDFSERNAEIRKATVARTF